MFGSWLAHDWAWAKILTVVFGYFVVAVIFQIAFEYLHEEKWGKRFFSVYRIPLRVVIYIFILPFRIVAWPFIQARNHRQHKLEEERKLKEEAEDRGKLSMLGITPDMYGLSCQIQVKVRDTLASAAAWINNACYEQERARHSPDFATEIQRAKALDAANQAVADSKEWFHKLWQAAADLGLISDPTNDDWQQFLNVPIHRYEAPRNPIRVGGSIRIPQ